MNKRFLLVLLLTITELFPVWGISRFLRSGHQVPLSRETIVSKLIRERNKFEVRGDREYVAQIDHLFRDTKRSIVYLWLQSNNSLHRSFLYEHMKQEFQAEFDAKIACHQDGILNKEGQCQSGYFTETMPHRCLTLVPDAKGSEKALESFVEAVVMRCPRCMSNIHSKK